jgi:hypothetical protein
MTPALWCSYFNADHVNFSMNQTRQAWQARGWELSELNGRRHVVVIHVETDQTDTVY